MPSFACASLSQCDGFKQIASQTQGSFKKRIFNLFYDLYDHGLVHDLQGSSKVCYGITEPSRDQADTSDYYNLQIIVPCMSRNRPLKCYSLQDMNHMISI